jgi:hypothetical protein
MKNTIWIALFALTAAGRASAMTDAGFDRWIERMNAEQIQEASVKAEAPAASDSGGGFQVGSTTPIEGRACGFAQHMVRGSDHDDAYAKAKKIIKGRRHLASVRERGHAWTPEEVMREIREISTGYGVEVVIIDSYGPCMPPEVAREAAEAKKRGVDVIFVSYPD